MCEVWAARESTVPWRSPVVFGLVRAESTGWSMAREEHSGKGNRWNLKDLLSPGEDFGLCSESHGEPLAGFEAIETPSEPSGRPLWLQAA